MDDLTPRFEELGKVVSGVSDRLADRSALDGARRRLLSVPPAQPVHWVRDRFAVGFFAAALVAVIALVWMLPRHADPALSFSVGWPAKEGRVGEWIAAEDNVPLRFSEGSTFSLDPGAKIRVASANAHGAFLLLEQGRVSAAVVHGNAETQWSLRAGPFDVRVTGTMFMVSWDPTGEVFELVMTEGKVMVMGPLLAPARELVAGERLRISVREHAMSLRVASTLDPPADAPHASLGSTAAPAPCAMVEPKALSSVGGPGEPSRSENPPLPKAAEALSAPSWRDLAGSGKYREALAAAERVGFADEVERASSGDLLLLADAARYGGRAALAHQALLRLRERFGARGRSAFLLGKIAADQQGSPGDAIRWFETYLREEPSGSLAEQATGRILEMRKGDKAAAPAAAKRYLDRYPNGSYSALARSLLSP